MCSFALFVEGDLFSADTEKEINVQRAKYKTQEVIPAGRDSAILILDVSSLI